VSIGSIGTSGPGPRPLLKPSRPPGSRSWAPFALLALGLASTLLLLGLDALRERLLTDDFALVRAAGDIESGLATSHLRMEQSVTGAAAVRPEEVWRGIERSLALVRAMLTGDRMAEGPWRLHPPDDPALRARAAALERDLQTFAEATLRRQAGPEGGEAVEPAEYDRTYRSLAAGTAGLRAAAEERLTRHLSLFRLASRAVLAGWLALAAVSFLGFRRFEARRQRDEAVLRDGELRLVQVQKMEAVGRLAGGLAHDINNYLAAIRSQCELVRRKPQPPERVAEKMGLVIGSVTRASALISRLLAFSRRQPIHPEVVNLNQLVLGLEKIVRQHLAETVELSLCLVPDLWNVKMDPTQVEQILVNLVVNARDAMPSGGKLVIETTNASFEEGRRPRRERRPVSAPGDYVLLTVSDTGVGIPPEIQDKIFEPFFTTKEGAGNTGLGLATIYGIVKQNGGNVWVDSEPEKGTIFRVYLPRTPEPLPAGAHETRTPRPVIGGTERILLVEDNADVRDSTAGLLESVGYSVTAAADGAQALAFLEGGAGRFDLLITDVVMPGLSGPEVAERVRARQGPLPVVFVSGYSESVIHYHGLLQPGVSFLSKPFAADALFRKVREALDPK
jgi:signal transduction histidine kinase/CheY-like chemotaxis protein